MKYCFNQWFSLGFLYAQSDYFDDYAVDDPLSSGGDNRTWSYRVECLTTNLRVMVQEVPKKSERIKKGRFGLILCFNRHIIRPISTHHLPRPKAVKPGIKPVLPGLEWHALK